MEQLGEVVHMEDIMFFDDMRDTKDLDNKGEMELLEKTEFVEDMKGIENVKKNMWQTNDVRRYMENGGNEDMGKRRT